MNTSTEASPSSGHSATAVKLDWVRRVRYGAGLLFWALLFPLGVINLVAFVLPFVGGRLDHLKWVGLIHVLAGAPVLMGVLALTTPEPERESAPGRHFLCRALQYLVILEVLQRIAHWVSRLTIDFTDVIYVALGCDLVSLLFTVSGLLYLRVLSLRFGADDLGRAFRAVAVVYTVFMLLDTAVYFLPEPRAATRYTATIFWILIPGALYAGIGIWGLVLLSRLRGRLLRVLENRCIRCAYPLRGLPEPRCPECGQAAWG